MYWTTLRHRQIGHHSADDILKCIFLTENVWISIEISLKLFFLRVQNKYSVISWDIGFAPARSQDHYLSQWWLVSDGYYRIYASLGLNELKDLVMWDYWYACSFGPVCIWPARINHPLNTWRSNNVVIMSKRRHFDVITSKWRRFDVITMSLLRNVSAVHVFADVYNFPGKPLKLFHSNLTSTCENCGGHVDDLLPPKHQRFFLPPLSWEPLIQSLHKLVVITPKPCFSSGRSLVGHFLDECFSIFFGRKTKYWPYHRNGWVVTVIARSVVFAFLAGWFGLWAPVSLFQSEYLEWFGRLLK